MAKIQGMVLIAKAKYKEQVVLKITDKAYMNF
jgi:hypothetical protein